MSNSEPTPSGSGSKSAPTPNAVLEDFVIAPEVFATDMSGIALAGGNAYMTFTSFRRNATHTAGAHVVNLRLVMPISSFKRAVALMQVASEEQEIPKP